MNFFLKNRTIFTLLLFLITGSISKASEQSRLGYAASYFNPYAYSYFQGTPAAAPAPAATVENLPAASQPAEVEQGEGADDLFSEEVDPEPNAQAGEALDAPEASTSMPAPGLWQRIGSFMGQTRIVGAATGKAINTVLFLGKGWAYKQIVDQATYPVIFKEVQSYGPQTEKGEYSYVTVKRSRAALEDATNVFMEISNRLRGLAVRSGESIPGQIIIPEIAEELKPSAGSKGIDFGTYLFSSYAFIDQLLNRIVAEIRARTSAQGCTEMADLFKDISGKIAEAATDAPAVIRPPAEQQSHTLRNVAAAAGGTAFAAGAYKLIKNRRNKLARKELQEEVPGAGDQADIPQELPQPE